MQQIVNYRTDFSQLYVSGSQQSDADTPIIADFAFVLSEDSNAKPVWDAETNVDERTGTVEATDVDINQITSEATLTQEKLTPDFLLWIGGILTNPLPANVQVVGDGWKTTCGFAPGPEPEGPYFTCVAIDGGAWGTTEPGGPARHKRFVGMAVDNIELTFARGEFATGSVSAIGTGKVNDALFTEIVVGADFGGSNTFNSTFTPYSENGLDHAQRITAMADLDDDGIFEYKLEITLATGDKIYTFADPGTNPGSHNITITYPVDSTEPGYDWTKDQNTAGFEPKKETKFKAQHIRVWINAEHSGGYVRGPTVTEFSGCELQNLSYSLSFNREAQACWRVAANSSSDYAARVERGNIEQRLTISREIIDYILAQHIDQHTTFGVEVDLLGAEWDSVNDPGNKFEARIIWPRCKVLNPDQAIDNGKHLDQVELAILGSDSGGLDTMTIIVQNQNDYYA